MKYFERRNLRKYNLLLASTHLPLYRFKYIKLLQAQTLANFRISFPNNCFGKFLFLPKILLEISKIYSFPNVFYDCKQYANLLNPV